MRTLLVSLFLVTIGTSEVDGSFSSSGIEQILNAHNSLKSRIARGVYVAQGVNKPRAANMVKYKWDTNLAKTAQNHANTCPKGHSKASDQLGENIFFACSSAPFTGDLNRFGALAAQDWENEFQEFGWRSNKMDMSLFNTGIAHASQMAWANSNLIGCGIKECKKGKTYELFVVCNYKPPGNVIGQSIYMEGPTCSACPAKTRCETITGLCVQSTQTTDPENSLDLHF